MPQHQARLETLKMKSAAAAPVSTCRRSQAREIHGEHTGASAAFRTGAVTSQVLAIYFSHLVLVCRQGLEKVCQHTIWGQP